MSEKPSIMDYLAQLLVGEPADIARRRRELNKQGRKPPGPKPTWSKTEGTPNVDYSGFREKDWDKVREHLGMKNK